MTNFIQIILAVIFLIGCSDQAQNGDGKRQGNEDNAVGKNPVKTVTDTDKTKPATEPTIEVKEDPKNPSPTGCKFKFSDKLSDNIKAKGNAQAPIIGNISFNLDADATLTIASSSTTASVGLNAKITAFSPSIARSIADNVVNSYKDPLKLTIVPAAKLADFYKKNAGWEKLNCIIVPVTKISNDAYEYEFEPALPMLLDPTSSGSDIDAAISSVIEISGIKSKLIRHFQPANVAKRGSYTGSAKIEKNGKSISISYDFGSKAPQALATPIAGISFEPSAEKGKFDSVTITSFVADDSKIDMKLSK